MSILLMYTLAHVDDVDFVNVYLSACSYVDFVNVYLSACSYVDFVNVYLSMFMT